jgi:hypothetical protein
MPGPSPDPAAQEEMGARTKAVAGLRNPSSIVRT